jgi:hypothetical protein
VCVCVCVHIHMYVYILIRMLEGMVETLLGISEQDCSLRTRDLTVCLPLCFVCVQRE